MVERYTAENGILIGRIRMDKIYQVFVSSTYQDLQEERKEVMQALLELDCVILQN